ncbi:MULTISPECIES: glycoside hydrolase family 1 protein [Clostridium]|uniref:glycoside hydrolase family 1 protein n=1 Tax=Clostridium TaxID=1485 RepID=UPI00082676A5|nr:MULTISPECIES: glycoside hydrolase family 1 protein [Clostridium]PJI10557.1 glycoside hydrolase family 1 protein [Clostridium sp. CT7]
MRHSKLKDFPKNFLWSASTSAYQIEGAWNEAGKGPSVQDTKEDLPEGTTDFKVASDHYHHVEEDIGLLGEMGLKAYRFSIAWTRIIPDGDGEVNKEGVEFYHKLIDACLKNNIEPIVTMYHFDLPWALEKKGGWKNRATIDAFLKFSKVIFKEYGSKVKYWLTINEQNMMILHGAVIGTKSGNAGNALKEIYQENHHMLIAQAKAMKLCHEMCPNSKIGPAPNICSIYPASSKPEDYIAAQNFSAIRNWIYLDMAVFGRYNPTAWAYLEERNATPEILEGDMEALKGANPDFIAFNYYNTATVEANNDDKNVKASTGDQQSAVKDPGVFQGVSNPNLKKTQFGWEIDPVGFRVTLREVYDRYHLPVIITENGLGAYDKLEDDTVHDDYRIEYYKEHLHQIKEALTDGVEVFGYSPWSAIDLVSTHEGITKRYGFVYVNRDEFDLKDLKRYKKDSFYWYKKTIENNGKDL